MCVSWNVLPYIVHTETHLTKFKKDLKITYFKDMFCDMRQ